MLAAVAAQRLEMFDKLKNGVCRTTDRAEALQASRFPPGLLLPGDLTPGWGLFLLACWTDPTISLGKTNHLGLFRGFPQSVEDNPNSG